MGVKLEKNDLTKSWLLWVTFGQQCYNFEIMRDSALHTPCAQLSDGFIRTTWRSGKKPWNAI